MSRKPLKPKTKPARRAKPAARPARTRTQATLSTRKATPARQATAKSSAKRTAKPSRSRKPDVLTALAAAGAATLALPVEPAWHAAIAFNLRLLFKHAALVEAFALTDESEPAPVFRA